MKETNRLLHEYCATGSESAFQELVARYLDLVYSVALRRFSGDSHLARDVAQTVFSDLARKAKSLGPDVQLGGWLHRHACFVANNFARTEFRRRAREQEAAHMQSNPPESAQSTWDDLSPELDDALQHLEPADRDAVMLRYFERLDLRAVGANFGVSEDAAQKRVSRAIEKLRQILVQRGVTLSVTALTTMLASQAIQVAPSGWPALISSAALKSGPVKLGLAASIAALFAPFFSKWGAAALGVALISSVALWQAKPKHFDIQLAQPVPTSSTTNLINFGTNSLLATLREGEQAPAAALAAGEEDALRLTIVAAATGLPLADVPIELRVQEGKKRSRHDLTGDSRGLCLVPIWRDFVTEVELITRLEGYADTRLIWRTDQGDEIPAAYTLRLERAVSIGGRVLDPEGKPILDAQVVFDHRQEASTANVTESHHFGRISTRTDSDGTWTINRIAESLLGKVHGSAEHSNFVRADIVQLAYHPQVLELLRAQKHVFSLGRPVTLRGVVVDSSDNPVPHAEVLFGQRGEVSSRTATTELDGSFTLQGCKPGTNLLSAQAPQFAPVTLKIDAHENSGPFRIVLSGGKILKLRIVNRAGEPIAGARLLPAAIEPTEAPALVTPTFSMKADRDGRIFWDQAPDREIAFDIVARGYMRTNEYRVRADNQEHTVVLGPALRIHGTVRDQTTQEPIPRFTLVTGRPETSYGSKSSAWWSPIDRHWFTFSNGKFDQTYDDYIIYNEKNPRFVFKIQADGYAPFITRAVEIDEGDVQFDVQLEPSARKFVTVLSPDGKPAPRTEVRLARPGEPVGIAAGGLAQRHGVLYLTTDADGKFEFQPEPDTVRVYAANPDGFGSATRDQIDETSTLRLELWARVEGTFTRRERPVPGLRMTLNSPPMILSPGEQPREPFLSLHQFAVTDEQGNFSLPKVPPGRFTLSYSAPPDGEWKAGESTMLEELALSPGESRRVTHNEDGADVSVTPIWPAEFATEGKLQIFGAIQTPSLQPPALVQGDPAALRQWRHEVYRRHKSWSLREQPDKRWLGGPIPPGQYRLSFGVWAVAGDSHKPLFSAERDIEVPPGIETIDLGAIELRAR